MTTIIFLPGIMGTRLYLDKDEQKIEVWPPTPQEMLFGYNRIDDLQDTNTYPGDIISKVYFKDFYATIQNTLRTIADAFNTNLIAFGYDWRRDIRATASLLAQKIKTLSEQGVTDVTLVAHSMGGLVVRYLLESGTYAQEAWFSNIKTFIGLSVPNLGSAKALLYTLGERSELGLSAKDIAQFTKNSNFPSIYQLLPAPNQSFLWLEQQLRLASLDVYDAQVSEELGLSLGNIQIAQQTWDKLNLANKPTHVKYAFLGGSGHKTITQVQVRSTAGRYKLNETIESDSSGDGTVALWSAILSAYQNSVSSGSHDSFFNHPEARGTLYKILGVRQAFSFSADAGTKYVNVSTQVTTYTSGDKMDVILVPSETSSTFALNGNVHIEKMDSEENFQSSSTSYTINCTGAGISLVRIEILAPQESGIYRIRFEGTHESNPEQECIFFVTTQGE